MSPERCSLLPLYAHWYCRWPVWRFETRCWMFISYIHSRWTTAKSMCVVRNVENVKKNSAGFPCCVCLASTTDRYSCFVPCIRDFYWGGGGGGLRLCTEALNLSEEINVLKHSRPWSAQVKERIELLLCAFIAGYRVNCTFTLVSLCCVFCDFRWHCQYLRSWHMWLDESEVEGTWKEAIMG